MVNLPSGSAIPGALAQLLAIATAALPDGTTVYFGPEQRAYTAPLTFQVSEIPGDQEPGPISPDFMREEKFSLVCSLIAYQGGVADFSGALADLMANFVLLSRAIANNPRLNEAVRFAQVGNFHVHPETDANGFSATYLDFSVRCEQRVTSLT